MLSASESGRKPRRDPIRYDVGLAGEPLRLSAIAGIKNVSHTTVTIQKLLRTSSAPLGGAIETSNKGSKSKGDLRWMLSVPNLV